MTKDKIATLAEYARIEYAADCKRKRLFGGNAFHAAEYVYFRDMREGHIPRIEDRAANVAEIEKIERAM